VRIVSVLPSATEIVCALGARSELVGRSAECDCPADVRDVPVVMAARTDDRDRPSAEIDRRVRRARAAGESLYELDVERLHTLRPDVLLTQDLCGVCSVTGEEVAVACSAAGVSPRIVSLAPRTLEEVWATFETVGTAIGRTDEARRLLSNLRRRTRPVAPRSTARVAVVEWLDPPILAGLWTPNVVHAAGGIPLGPASGTPGQRTTWKEVAALEPDLLLLSPCSFSVDRTSAELADPGVARPLRGIAPARGTYVADEAFFSRPGPRLADGVELVRGLLRGEELRSPMPVARWSATGQEAVA
jgi:iron complex transport system substrate-binding protein